MLRITPDAYLCDSALEFNVLAFLSLKDLFIATAVSSTWQAMIKKLDLEEIQVTPASQNDFTWLLINLIKACNYNQIQRHIEYGIQHGFQLNQIYPDTVKLSSSISLQTPTPLLLSSCMLTGQAGVQIAQSLMYQTGFDFFLYYTSDNNEIILSDNNESLEMIDEGNHRLVIADSKQLKKARELYTPILIRSNDDFFVYRPTQDQKQTWRLIPLITDIEDEDEELNELRSFPFMENQLIHIQKKELSHIAFNLIYDFEYIGPENRRLSTYFRDGLFSFERKMVSPMDVYTHKHLFWSLYKLAECEEILMKIQTSGRQNLLANLM